MEFEQPSQASEQDYLRARTPRLVIQPIHAVIKDVDEYSASRVSVSDVQNLEYEQDSSSAAALSNRIIEDEHHQSAHRYALAGAIGVTLLFVAGVLVLTKM